MRKVLFFAVFLLIILAGIGMLFWEQEYKYILPTPVPDNLREVRAGDSARIFITPQKDQKGLFIHFYNNDCPCSRFNIREFQAMVRKYSGDIRFVAVVQSKADEAADHEFISKYDLGIEVIHDKEGALADSLGVYSTPQAVIVRDGKVFYKGNYNRARFCVSRNTKFAEIAMEALIKDEDPPYFPEVAIIPYGCQLPSHEKESTNTFKLSSIF